MPPRKRQRADKDDGEEGPGTSAAKRKRKILNYDPHDIIHELYDTIRNHKTEDSRLLCESFIRVPKRRSAADYYDVVTTPIDMLKIQQKVKTDSYDYVDQLSADILLMVNNAKAYYKKPTQEYRDACELMELYERTRADLVEAVFGSGERVVPSRRSPSTKDIPDLPEPEDESEEEEEEEEVEEDEDEDDGGMEGGGDETSDDLEQLFAAIVTTKDGDRDISQAFQLLPQRAKYPQYFEVIKKPIDLKTIAMKIQNGNYLSLDDLESDLLLMVKNAKTFNEPRSLIYRDAVTLQKIIGERKRELEYKKSGNKTSGRLRTKGERSITQKMSAVCAALKYQQGGEAGAAGAAGDPATFDLDADMEAGSGQLVEDDPQWILFNHMKDNILDQDGDPLTLPFMKMPSKRLFPDYYKEIKKPMSMNKIRSKIEMNVYETVMDLARDFVLMFKNAKTYNHDDSQIFKDAVTLQQAMIDKIKELDEDLAEEFLEEYENNNDDEDEEDEDAATSNFEEDEEVTPTAPRRGRKPAGTNINPETGRRNYVRRSTGEDSLKKRLRSLFTSVYDYADQNGRLLRPIFMTLPSRKDYPDYYQVIMEPIDLSMIQEKLKTEKYTNEQSILSDFELMFNNARHYNEAGSQVYQDANTLDKALRGKWKYLSQQAKIPGTGRRRPKSAKTLLEDNESKATEASPLAQKLQDLYESVRDHQDRSGRALSAPFIKLPNKVDYPDYYEVIKRPMDMMTIQQKMMMNKYDNIEEMVADFVLLFDNACKYNEPESVIYKDALNLQRVVFQKKLELISNCNEVPEVRALTLELMKNLFITSFNYMDDEGRCYSDSFAELVEKDKTLQLNGEVSEKPLTFDQIRKNLDKGRYKRVDCFQDDMFKVFERARDLSRLDSQLYEDAVEMQKFFIKTRDELCNNGELLLTPALSYTPKHLAQALEAESKFKAEAESSEASGQQDGQDVKKEDDAAAEESSEPSNSEETHEFKGQTYSIGDFVYISARDAPEPHIMNIESFGKDESGQETIKGKWYYRPAETYHHSYRKFLEKEVFLSEVNQSQSMSEIIGRCCVLSVKDYFKFKPEGLQEKDIYVCESRYSTKHRQFKKIKLMRGQKSINVKLVEREVPLIPIRVASQFVNKEASETSLDDGDSVIDKKREHVISETEGETDKVYYDQYVNECGCFKLGDGVYIRNSEGLPTIARIDRLWTDKIGETFFHYTPYLRPSEVEHAPNRLFYKQEVFQAGLDDCALVKNIVGKCCILHIKEYCSSRPTEIPEHDIFIIESKYIDSDKSMKKVFKLKKYTLSPKVVDDEIYFFRKAIVLEKEPSPLLMKGSDLVYIDTADDSQAEASNDGLSFSPVPSPAPASQKRKKREIPVTRRLPSGYIVFAGENRKQILDDSPGMAFGDVSKIVGNRWRGLSKSERETYEAKAKKMSEELLAKDKQQKSQAAIQNAQYDARSQSPWSDHGGPSTPVQQAAGGSSISLVGGGPQTQATPPHQGHAVNGYHSPPSPIFDTVPPRRSKIMHSEVYIKYIESLQPDSRWVGGWQRELATTRETAPAVPEAQLPGDWLAHGAGRHGSVTNALWALRDYMLKDAVGLARTLPFNDL